MGPDHGQTSKMAGYANSIFFYILLFIIGVRANNHLFWLCIVVAPPFKPSLYITRKTKIRFLFSQKPGLATAYYSKNPQKFHPNSLSSWIIEDRKREFTV